MSGEVEHPGWRVWVAVAVAVASVFVVVPVLRRALHPPPPVPAEDLALIHDLEFAEALDVLSHPDFDLLVRWDGEEP